MINGWRSIPSYEGLYEASNQGQIRNAKTGLVLKPYLQGRYLSVTLHKDGQRRVLRVHVLVLLTFFGPRPQGKVGAHLNGDASDNAAINLAWTTTAENEAHKIAHGTHNRGVRSVHAKFSSLQVQIIREAHSLGLSVDKIGLLTGVYGSTIAEIVNGTSYSE